MLQSIAVPATRDPGTIDTIPGTVTLKLPESTSPVAGTIPETVPGMYNQSAPSRGHDTVCGRGCYPTVTADFIAGKSAGYVPGHVT